QQLGTTLSTFPSQFQHPSSFANFSQPQSSQSYGTQPVNLSQSEGVGVVERQKGKGRRRSTKTTTNAGGRGSQLLKWTGIQNKNLVKAWVYVSEDRIKDNNQQLDIFWESVLDAFHEFCQEDGERVERTVSSLKYHWSDMNRGCKVYGTCLKNVMQCPISSMQQENLVSNSTFVITNYKLFLPKLYILLLF
ncbi:hypothetical protein GIB67_021039, partial [Kingdonia uniflora]